MLVKLVYIILLLSAAIHTVKTSLVLFSYTGAYSYIIYSILFTLLWFFLYLSKSSFAVIMISTKYLLIFVGKKIGYIIKWFYFTIYSKAPFGRLNTIA